MTYIAHELKPGENVVCRSKLHFIIYVRSLGIIGLGSVMWFLGPLSDTLSMLGAAVILWGIVRLVDAWIERTTTEIAVTDQRVIFKTGLMQRDGFPRILDAITIGFLLEEDSGDV